MKSWAARTSGGYATPSARLTAPSSSLGEFEKASEKETTLTDLYQNDIGQKFSREIKPYLFEGQCGFGHPLPGCGV